MLCRQICWGKKESLLLRSFSLASWNFCVGIRLESDFAQAETSLISGWSGQTVIVSATS